MLDRSPCLHEGIGTAASPLAERLDRRALAESRHAVQSPIRPNRFPGITLPLALRVCCTFDGGCWLAHHDSCSLSWFVQWKILYRIPVVRLPVRHSYLDRFCSH